MSNPTDYQLCFALEKFLATEDCSSLACNDAEDRYALACALTDFIRAEWLMPEDSPQGCDRCQALD